MTTAIAIPSTTTINSRNSAFSNGIFIVTLLVICNLMPHYAQAQIVRGVERMVNNDLDEYINPAMAPFYHGVASGDPLPNRVILWTRVTPIDSSDAPIEVAYELATDLEFDDIVLNGTFVTDTSRDYTVKVDAIGLQANTYYYYRFQALDSTSVVGRTKTAPDEAVEQIRLAAMSCSDYRWGFYNSLVALSERNDIDAVLHLGDYIYEYAATGTVRDHSPNIEVWQLQHYRNRYSQYHLDPDLQRCHQVYPWIHIWDDHEIVVDALRDTSYRHDAEFGTYQARKQAAIQAVREWLPIRDPEDVSTNFYKNWRTLPYGNLLDVVMIDVRLYDRDRFAESVDDTIYNSPTHKLLGPEQLGWLNSELANSEAQWKVIGNQLMIGHLYGGANPLIMENWHGYPVERNQFYDNLIDNEVDNVVFVTGDFHVSIINDLNPDPTNTDSYNPDTGAGSLGVEFVVPSLTSDNFDEGSDFGLPSAEAAVTLIGLFNPHIKAAELTSHGYVLLDIQPERLQAEYWYAENIIDPLNHSEQLGSMWLVQNEANRVQTASEVSTPKPAELIAEAPPIAPNFSTEVGVNSLQNQPVVLSVYPNPSKTFTYLNYVLPTNAAVNLQIMDIQGRIVQSILAGEQQARGNYVVQIPTASLQAGVYFIQLSTPNYNYTKKLLKTD